MRSALGMEPSRRAGRPPQRDSDPFHPGKGQPVHSKEGQAEYIESVLTGFYFP